MYGIFEFDQAKALVAVGVNVKFLAVDLRSIRRWRHFGLSKEIRSGVECYKISIPVGIAPQFLLCKIGTVALKRLYQYAYDDELKPDLIHAHFTIQGYMAAELAKEINVPLVITEHSSEMNKEKIRNSLLKIAIDAYSAAKTVIAVGTPLSKSIKEKTGKECIVIPNIVDVSIFGKCVRRHTAGKEFTLVSVGGLIKRKHMDLLISAFAKVHKQIKNTRLIIFGQGKEELALRSMIADAGLQKNVMLEGLVPREKIAATYEIADAFVLLSERETFGVAYIEALAAGLPVVATKCQGPEDFMCDEFGYLIDTNDEAQAVDAMIAICERIHEYSPEKISNLIKTRYSPETIAGELIAVYAAAI
jgi:Glycosyltransferase